MESLAVILTSDNAKVVLFFAVIIILLLWIMARRGVFSVNKGGLKIGKTENEVRTLLLKMNNYVEEFCESECVYLISKMVHDNYEMNYNNTRYVFRTVQNEIMSWLLVNHIQVSSFYLQGRIRDIKNIVGRSIGEINPTLRQNEDYMAQIFDYCEDFTERLLTDLCNIRDEEMKNMV